MKPEQLIVSERHCCYTTIQVQLTCFTFIYSSIFRSERQLCKSGRGAIYIFNEKHWCNLTFFPRITCFPHRELKGSSTKRCAPQCECHFQFQTDASVTVSHPWAFRSLKWGTVGRMFGALLSWGRGKQLRHWQKPGLQSITRYFFSLSSCVSRW